MKTKSEDSFYSWGLSSIFGTCLFAGLMTFMAVTLLSSFVAHQKAQSQTYKIYTEAKDGRD